MIKKIAAGTGALLVLTLTPIAAWADCQQECKSFCTTAGYKEGSGEYQACFTGCIGNKDPATCQKDIG